MSVIATILGEPRAIKYSGRSPQDPRLVEYFEIANTSAGESVNESSALRLIAVYACIRVICEDVGKLPFMPYRRIGRGKERVEGRLFTLLHDQPNPEMCACTFRETVTGWALRTGNGFAEIVKDNAGRAVEMWPIESDRVLWELDRGTGGIVYKVDNRVVPSDLIFHLRAIGGDGITGWSPIRVAREAIAAGLVTERFSSAFFRNNASGGAVLEHPSKLSDEAHKRLRESMEEQWAGADNAYKTKILEEGMKLTKTSIPPEDAQFVETRQLTIEEIARLYRVAPHKIQHLLRATFSNIEMQSIEHVQDTLTPWLVRWEQETNRKVISRMNRQAGVFAEHSVNGLLRGDMTARAEFYAKMFQIGALSENDILEKENMNGIGPRGDVYYVPTNLAPARSQSEIDADKQQAQQAFEQQPEPDADGDEEQDKPAAEDEDNDRALRQILDAHSDLVTDALLRLDRIETDRIGRRSTRPLFARWLDEFRHDHAEHVRAAIGSPLDAAARSIWSLISRNGGGPDMEAVTRFTADRARTHCDRLPRPAGFSIEYEARQIMESLTAFMRKELADADAQAAS